MMLGALSTCAGAACGTSVRTSVGRMARVHSERCLVQLSSTAAVKLESRLLGRPRPRRTTSQPAAGVARRAPTCSLLDILPNEQVVFNFENVAVFPFWGAMILAPRWDVTKKVMTSYALFGILGAIYIYLAYVSLSEPAIAEGFSTGSPDLAALTKAFSYEKTVAVGWAHFIAADLFAGRWVYLDGLKNSIFTRHSLLLCLFFGPTGVVSHLLTRAATAAVRGEELEDIMVAGGKESSVL